MVDYRKMALALGTLGVLTQAVQAGPVADFEASLRQAYGEYRVALFATNSGDAEKSKAAIKGFEAKWTELAEANMTPPPQYADDPAYKATLEKVGEILGEAGAQAGEGQLTEAHETLEAIRDQIGSLHERNGIVGFSDRMNAYHARMEEILARDYGGFDEAGMGMLREDAAVLSYLAEQIADHPPAEASDPAYGPLLAAMRDSATALEEAARDGNSDDAAKAVSGLKVPYSKLFLKFG